MGRNRLSCVPCLVDDEWIHMCNASDELSDEGRWNSEGERRTGDLAPHVREKSGKSMNCLPETPGVYTMRDLLG